MGYGFTTIRGYKSSRIYKSNVEVASYYTNYWVPQASVLVERYMSQRDKNYGWMQYFQQFSLSKYQHPLRPIDSRYLFEMISLDTGHVTLNSGQREYFMVAIDHFTKWFNVQALIKETGNVLALFLRHAISFQHKCPEKLLTKNRPAYAWRFFLERMYYVGS